MNQVKGNGASQSLFGHSRPNSPQRSRFDLSQIKNLTLDTGMIVPVDLVPTLPNDDLDFTSRYSLDTLPLIAPSLTNYKVKFHYYYSKNRDLWKGWNTFITKGRSGNINLKVPTFDFNLTSAGEYQYTREQLNVLIPALSDVEFTCYKSETSLSVDKFVVIPTGQHSLAAYLGIPFEFSGVVTRVNLNSDNSIDSVITLDYLPYVVLPAVVNGTIDILSALGNYLHTFNGFNSPSNNSVSALPFVMYQQIVKNYYVNQNLLQDNKSLFPDEGDDDWLIPYSATSASLKNISGWITNVNPVGNFRLDGVFSASDTAVDFAQLRYCQFDDDYFTTALPWLQRGDVNSLDMNVVFDDDVFARVTTYDSDAEQFADSNLQLRLSSTSGSTVAATVDSYRYMIGNNSAGNIVIPYVNRNNSADIVARLGDLYGSGSVSASITANQLRELIALSVWQERNARVDGSYNRMIYQHWLTNPHSEEHKPEYIGGNVGYLNFSTIIQNSQSTSSSPLGSIAGYGSSNGNSDNIHFHSPDYGFVMCVAMIVPNSVYQQGLEHCLTELNFSDFVQPEFEGLSPQPILNKELYVGSSNNDDLFAYQERYTYLKVRQNVNRGLFQAKPSSDILFSAMTQARYFSSLPKLSYQFVVCSPENLRRDWLAYPKFPVFRMQLLNEVFITRSLAYNSTPNTFGF